MKSNQARTYRLAVLNSHPIQYFAPLYRRLAQEPDIELTVYYCSRQGLKEYLDPGFGEKVQWDVPLLDGYKSKFLTNWRSMDGVSGFFSLINPTIIAELWCGQYDAVLIHGHNYVSNLLAIVAAKLCGTAVFMRGETHLLLQRSSLKQWLRKGIMTVFYRICDVCLPIGTRNAEFYRYHGVTDERMFLVPYTVDNDFFRQAADRYRADISEVKQELGIPTDKAIILYASKLIGRKRPIDLLIAFHRLRLGGDVAALLFIGSGHEEAELRRYTTEHQIPDVFFFGFQNQSALPRFYACADVFVLPAEDEPWGLIINEVMATGIPVITTDEVGAAVDLVKQCETGFNYPVGNIEILTRYLKLSIENAALREQWGKNALRVMNQWSYEECIHGVRAALNYVS